VLTLDLDIIRNCCVWCCLRW